MNKYKTIGYILLIVGVILFLFSIILYQKYAEANLMLETFGCISSSCISRASIFLPSMLIGLLSLCAGLVTLADDLYKKFASRSKSQ